MHNLLKIVSFLALAGISWAQTCVQNTNCFNGACEAYDFCACGSGYSNSDNCLAATSYCPGQWANVSQLTTANYPTLDTTYSGVRQGNLKIRVTSPLVNGREATFLYLADPVLYPGCALGNWTKSFLDTPDCAEQYDLDLSWVDAVNCGFVEDLSEAGFASYTNNLFVKHKDMISNFRGTPVYRDTIHTFPVVIKFKTSVTVDTALNVFAPVNLLAAITRQTYDPVTSSGVIEFTTSLQWPFELSAATLNGVPVQLNVTLGSNAISCPATAGAACDQLYTLSVTPDQACSLSGNYQLSFTVVCRGSPADCPLDTATASATVTGVVNSENFCAGLSLNIGLSGSLAVYGDNAFAVDKNDFLHGQVAYFQATLSTDNTATIVDSAIVEVRITDGTTSKYLRSSSAPTASGLSVGLADMDAASTASQPAFQLTPNNDVFTVPVDGQVQFTVFATIDVSYTGNLKKRFVMKRQIQPGSQNAETNALVLVAGPASASGSAASSQESSDVLAPASSSTLVPFLALALF